MIRLVALDLDGTVVGQDGSVSPGVVQAVRRVQERGILVTVATGRVYPSARRYLQELHLGEVPVITCNGAEVWAGDGRRLWYRPLAPRAAARVVEICLSWGVRVASFVGDEVFLVAADAGMEGYARAVGLRPRRVGGHWSALWAEAPAKITGLAHGSRVDAVRRRVAEALGEEVVVTTSAPTYLEVLGRGVSKGAALAEVIRRLGISPGEVLAVGDAENDLDMLQLAGVGVAMGNAPARVQAAARHVTASWAEDGVARALERWVLKG